MNKKEISRLGEDYISHYLIKNYHKILERNYISKNKEKSKKEIDIIAQKNEVIHFIEVKTSKYDISFAIQKMNEKKIKNIKECAQDYISNFLNKEYDFSFDFAYYNYITKKFIYIKQAY